MNDEFLHRLRVDPSRDFAVRLKARLDAQSATATGRVSRWGIPLLIFGVAFALALPNVREGIVRLVTGAQTPVVTTPRQATPSEPVLTEAIVTARRLASVPLDTGVATPPARLPSPPPAERYVLPLGPLPQDEEVADKAARLEKLIARAAPLPERSVADAVPHSSTMQDEAQAALELRRSVFKVMGRASEPLLAMAQGRRRLDPDAVATSAVRIYELALLIPEAFKQDTAGIQLQTAARDTIWTTKPRFDMEARELAAASMFLLGSLRSGNSYVVSRGLGKVLTACDNCHADYRTTQ